MRLPIPLFVFQAIKCQLTKQTAKQYLLEEGLEFLHGLSMVHLGALLPNVCVDEGY